MNELVIKFARECGAWNQVYRNRTFLIDEHFDIEKFAELIVRECAVIADMERPNYLGCGYITKTQGDVIKQHFRVNT